MIRVLAASLLIALLPARPDAEGLFSCDKGAHFGASAILFQASALAFRNGEDVEARAAVLTLGLGVLKELYDLGIEGETFDEKDLLFDALGVLFGCSLILWNRSLDSGPRR